VGQLQAGLADLAELGEEGLGLLLLAERGDDRAPGRVDGEARVPLQLVIRVERDPVDRHQASHRPAPLRHGAPCGEAQQERPQAGVDPERDVEGCCRVEHGLDAVAQHRGLGEGDRHPRGEPPGVPPRRARRDGRPLQDGDLHPPLLQEPGRGQADDPGPDDDDVLRRLRCHGRTVPTPELPGPPRWRRNGDVPDSREILTRPAPPPSRTVRYGPGAHEVYEVYAAADRDRASSRPGVVLVHGGFWRSGYDRTHLRPLATRLAADGWDVALLEYRGTGADGGGWPRTLDDVRAGLARMQEEPGPLARPVLVGHSAGGHLAVCLLHRPEGAVLPGAVSLAGCLDLALVARLGLGEGAAVALLGG